MIEHAEIEALTWLGAFLFFLCGVAQAVACWRRAENARGMSWWFLATWFGGEVSMFGGMAPIASPHVLANYVFSGVLIAYMAGVKFSLPRLPGAEH